MILKIDKSFAKDFRKSGNEKLKPKLLSILENIQAATKVSDIKNIKKLRGSSGFYRIKLGDYRIGMIITKQEVQLIRFLHRKDIYRYFP